MAWYLYIKHQYGRNSRTRKKWVIHKIETLVRSSIT
jgi:hypothetical protein